MIPSGKIGMALSSVLCGALLLPGCAPTVHARTAAGAQPIAPVIAGANAAQIVTIALFSNANSHYWVAAERGAIDTQGSQSNVKIKIVRPMPCTAANQVAKLEQLVSEGVQAAALSPSDAKAITPALNDAARKIALITIDSDAPQSNRLCYIGTDNRAAGIAAAALIKNALPHGGKAMLFVGNTQDLNAAERAEGIRSGLAGSNVGFAGITTDDSDKFTAMSNALRVLTTRQDVTCLVGLWDYDGPAILRAVRAKHRVGKVKIVCWDDDPDTIAGIKSGAIYGTMVQQPYEFGHLSANYLARAVKGDRSWLPASRRIYVPIRTVTKANVGAYAARI